MSPVALAPKSSVLSSKHTTRTIYDDFLPPCVPSPPPVTFTLDVPLSSPYPTPFLHARILPRSGFSPIPLPCVRFLQSSLPPPFCFFLPTYPRSRCRIAVPVALAHSFHCPFGACLLSMPCRAHAPQMAERKERRSGVVIQSRSVTALSYVGPPVSDDERDLMGREDK